MDLTPTAVGNLGKIAIVRTIPAGLTDLRTDKRHSRTQRSSDEKGLLVGCYREDLCLGFVNTLSWRGRAVPAEALRTVFDLLDWIERSEVLPRRSVEDARQWARLHEEAAAQGFIEAIAVREALFGVFSSIAEGASVDPEDFLTVGAALVRGPHRARLVATPQGFAWRGPARGMTIPDILAPVLWSAGDLLVAGGDRLIRRCANDECRWLFIDQSKTNSRRWCDMRSCGNRAKARRHYARSKQS